MDKEQILAGLDVGHICTKAVLLRGHEILAYATVPTGFDVVAAAQAALQEVSNNGGISCADLAGIAVTGIFRDRVKRSPLNVTKTVPDDAADAKGALFLNRNSRTVIDIGGNIHKAVRYDEKGSLLDVIQNDKCADGLGIFYTTVAKALGISAQELSGLALQSTKDVSVAITCAVSAESEAIDLICQGVEVADVADAVSRFIAERVAAMCTTLSLEREIVVAGGLAKSKPIVKHLQDLLKRDVSVLSLPEYAGAIGALMSDEGGK